MKAILTTSLLATAMVATSYSQSLIYESFSQDTSGGTALSGKAGGTGLSGNWGSSGTNDILSFTTLDYGDLQNSGGELRMDVGAGNDAFVSTSSVLADNDLLDDGATLWFSFIIEKSGVGGNTNAKGGFAFGTDRIDGAFNGTNMTNSGNGLGLQLLGSNISAASWQGGGNFNSTGATLDTNGGAPGGGFTADTTYFLVGRIDWGATAGDDETITIYNPSTSGLALPASFSTATMSGVDQTLFDTISMTHRNDGEDNVFYDEIRFGASYADVSPVPEPGSFALLGGLLALTSVMLRRRRS